MSKSRSINFKFNLTEYPIIDPYKYRTCSLLELFSLLTIDFPTLILTKSLKESLTGSTASPLESVTSRNLNESDINLGSFLENGNLTLLDLLRPSLLSIGEYVFPPQFIGRHFVQPPFYLLEPDQIKVENELKYRSGDRNLKVEDMMGYCLDNSEMDIAFALSNTPSLSKTGKNDYYTERLSCDAEDGKLDLCKFLLKIGALVDSPDYDYSPLYAASKAGHLEICTLLIENGADINNHSKEFQAPLYVASEMGHIDICRMLIERGAQIDKSLIGAISKGHLEICKLLVSSGASLQTVDANGIPLLSLAVQKGRVEVVKYLLSLDVEVNTPGRTALHIVSETSRVDIAVELIANGANLSARDELGQTPLFLAAANDRKEMRLYLNSLSKKI